VSSEVTSGLRGALAGKSVVIIGGTAGLGLAGARACLDAGAASVVAVGRDDDSIQLARELLRADRSEVIVADANDPGTAPKAIERAIARAGRFDALYHVAGGSGRSAGDGPLHEITDAGWDRTFEMNLRSAFYSNRAALAAFVRDKVAGSILNTGSVLAFSPSPKFFATHAYAASKAGLIGMTRAAAAHYAPLGIRLNVLAPGLVDTPMARRAANDATIQKFIATKQPLDGGRIGAPADFDSAVVFFLSDASRFCTGQVLAIDGGWCVSDGQIPT
jgi:NAD(P)-dependent dehydrogenase (short-subunit alcohol dehydrogenase family)